MSCPQIPVPSTRSGVSRLAIAAFVLSLAGFFLSAGVPAVVLGILSLRRIDRSGQAIRGRCLAKAAIVLPIVTALLLFTLTAMNTAHAVTPERVCELNLSSIRAAMLLYAIEHNDQLPTPSRWCELLASAGVEPRVFRCPGTQRVFPEHFYPFELYLYRRHQLENRPQGPCDYAMNEHATSAAGPPDLVLCFDSGPGWNRSGGPGLLTTDHHDGRGCNVLFLDTHVEFIKAEELGRLKWKPAE